MPKVKRKNDGGNPKHSPGLSLIVDVLEFRGLASSLTERRGCVELTFDWFKVERPAPRRYTYLSSFRLLRSDIISRVLVFAISIILSNCEK